VYNFSLFLSVQTGFEAYTASNSMDLGASPPGVKKSGLKMTTHLHLVPKSRRVELYLHSPIWLHGIVLNQLSTGTDFLLSFTINGEKRLTLMEYHDFKNGA
jgi:hypothetical protein